MKKAFMFFVAIIFSAVTIFSVGTAQQGFAQQSDMNSINDVLDSFHDAAAEGDWQRYFALTSADFVFLGTDVAERWPRAEFISYSGGRSGWVYRPVGRNINLTPDGQTAWFDEVLDSQSYGTSRGTGVLIKGSEGWTISQYHLTLPIPNELARKVTDEIKAFEAANPQ